MKENKFKIGDLVTIIRIAENLKNSSEMRTKKVFALCLGKTYEIQDFGKYGHIELMVGKDVDRAIGGLMNTIWIEPNCVVLAKSAKKN